MHQLEISRVPNWTRYSSVLVPQSIDAVCPLCHRVVTFTYKPSSYDSISNIVLGLSRCPACSKNIKFLIVEPSKNEQNADIFMFPKPRETRNTKVKEGVLAAKLFNSYKSTLDAYNASLWSPSVNSCRRTLEGIVITLLPEEEREGTLYSQLKKLPGLVDLSKPFIELADALRKGGNIGSHFDLEREPDENFARALIDLLEYIIEYVYVLPSEAKELEKRLDEIADES